MVQLFKAKVRKIGTSVGVLIPKENVGEAQIQEDDEVEIALLSHTKDFSGFGMAKKFIIPFQRDKKTRDFV